METVRRVGLDTNVFMGIFLEESDKSPSLQIVRLISEGGIEGVVSSISLIEVATLFYQKGEMQKGKRAVDIIRGLSNTTIVDVTADTDMDIANIKISERLSMADAAVLSSAVVLNSDVFLTYDKDFAHVKRIRCMKPEDYLKALEKEKGCAEVADE